MEVSLEKLSPGQYAMVEQIAGSEAFQQGLQGYGLVPGTVVQCRYRCPGGALTALSFRGTVLAVRTAQLKGIRGIAK